MSPDGPRRPTVLIFDVNETLSDMSPMAGQFEDVGAPGHLAKSSPRELVVGAVAGAVRDLGLISQVTYWVPAAVLVIVLRRVWPPALVLLAATLVGVGYTMFAPLSRAPAKTA